MADDNKRISDDTINERRVIQDSHNNSGRTGRSAEEASLSFTFDKDIKQASEYAEVRQDALHSNDDASDTDDFAEEKSYGLPEDYSNPAAADKAADEPPAAAWSGSSAFAEAKGKFKKFVEAQQLKAKEASAAAAERRKEREKEAAKAKAARDLEAAERAAAKAEAARIAAIEAEAARKAAEAEAAARAAEEAEAARRAAEEAEAARLAAEAEEAARAAAEAEEAARAAAEAEEAEKAAAETEKAEAASAKKTPKNAAAVPGKKVKASAKSQTGKPKAVKAKSTKTTKAKKDQGQAKTAAKQTENNKSAKSADKSKTSKTAAAAGSKQKKPRKKLWWLWAIIKLTIAFGLVCCICGAAYASYTISHAPAIHPDQIYSTLDVSTHIYDDKGKLIDDVFFSENREIVDYEQLPDNLKNAFIAIEDKTFWEHKGFNFKRIFGAVWNSLTGGGEISGTSTITQQLARNVFLPEEKSVRSIKRKIIEMYYAHEIEEVLSKEEILTAYLNTIYLGYGCYGVDTAAKYYFSKKIEKLSLEQCASLAALPQAPGIYALLVNEADEDDENCTKLKKGLYANDISAQRRYMVLDLMAEQGYITAEEAEEAKKPLTEFIKPGRDNVYAKSAFKDYLIQTVKSDLMSTYNITDEEATELVYAKGLHIYSTLDTQAQKVVTKEFKNKESFPESLKKSKVESAMVIVEVGTGEIKAMAGTRKVSGEMLFNRAVSPRQPGSSIKPIAVYAPALQKSYEYQKDGKKFQFRDTGYDKQGAKGWGDYITAISSVRDEPMKVNGKKWPQNFSRSYSGNRTFRTAIQQSINTCAVKILAQIGVDYSMDMVKKFGISTAIDDTSEPYNDVNLAALGLGAMTEGVTPLDMALAYATFPNGGVRNTGICYTKVTDRDGKVLLEGKSEKVKVLDKGVAFIMTDVLQTVVEDGIAYNAAIPGEKVGGKTGTTDQTWDIWFDGFTPKYAAALWIGTDDNTTLNCTSMVAASLWSKIMSQVKGAKGGTYKSRPDNVILQDGEYYTKGTQPPRIVIQKKDPKKDSKTTTGKDAKADSSKKDSDKKKD